MQIPVRVDYRTLALVHVWSTFGSIHTAPPVSNAGLEAPLGPNGPSENELLPSEIKEPFIFLCLPSPWDQPREKSLKFMATLI